MSGEAAEGWGGQEASPVVAAEAKRRVSGGPFEPYFIVHKLIARVGASKRGRLGSLLYASLTRASCCLQKGFLVRAGHACVWHLLGVGVCMRRRRLRRRHALIEALLRDCSLSAGSNVVLD